MCAKFVNHSRFHSQGEGGEEDLCGFLMVHCECTLMIQDDSRLIPKVYRNDHDFFRYICGHKEIFDLANPRSIR